MSGPKPLPKNVLALRGSWRANAGADRPDVDAPVEIPGCPDHLLPEARAFWDRLAPELEKLGLVALIDEAALALVCQEWAHLVWHERALQADIDAAAKARAEWDARPRKRLAPWTKGNGFMLPTPNGSFTYSPHWVARNKHAQLLDKFLTSFGMSPSSRGRVTAGDRRQLNLPGVDEPPAGGFSAL